MLLLSSFPPNKTKGLQEVTFHGPTGKNNQKGQNRNTDLLLFPLFACYLLKRFTKKHSGPWSLFVPSSFSLLDLSTNSPPLSAVIFLPHRPWVCLLFFLDVWSQLSELYFVPRSPFPNACFSARHKLASFTSSLPAWCFFLCPVYFCALCLFSVCFHSCGCCIVNTPYPAAIWRASF